MTKKKALIIIGILIAILPFLSFPISWDHFFMFIGGIAVVILAVLVGGGDSAHPISKEKTLSETFIQNEPPQRSLKDSKLTDKDVI